MKIQTKKRIAATAGFLALLVMLTLVGGCEMGWMSTSKGLPCAALCELVGAFLLWKAGVVRL